MSNVTTKWILELADRISGPMQKLSQKIEGPSAAFTKLQDKLDKFQGAFSEIPGAASALSLATNPIAAAGAAIAAITTGGIAATKMAYNFEEGMAKINATAGLTPQKLAILKNQLQEVGADAGKDFNRIPESFEKIISTIGDTGKSMEILKASVLGSKAGFADLDVVADSLSSTISIIGAQKANAQEVLDVFMMAKNVGKGEFADFATYMPTLISAGKNLGIGFKDTAGMFAYMTTKTASAADATTLMQNAFTALGKSQITDGLKKAGINVFDKDGMIRDMGTIFTELGNMVNGMSSEGKSKFFESIGLNDAQAKTAFGILSSNAVELTDKINATNNAMGITVKTLADTQNPSRTWSDILGKLSFFLVKIGDRLLPIVDKFLTKVGSAMQWLKNHTDEIKTALSAFGDILSVVWTVLKVGLIILSPFAVVLAAVGVAAFIATSPFTALFIVITALYVGFKLLWNHSEKFRGTIMGVWAVIKGFGSALKTYVLDVVHSLISGITGLGDVFSKLFSGDFKGAFESGKQVVKDFANVAIKGSGFGLADALYQEGKTSKEKFNKGFTEGATQVATKDWKPSFDFNGGGSVDANSISGNKAKSGAAALSAAAKDKLSGSGSGGGSGTGKTITMRLDIKNYFNGVAGDLDKQVDELAKKFVTKINDGLRDAVVALD